MRPREHKRLDSQVCHFGHDLLQKYFEHIVPRGNITTFSQKYEIPLALGHIGQRRIADACSHDKLWCTGLSACDLSAFFPDIWYVVSTYWVRLKNTRAKSFSRKPLRRPVTSYCRKPGFHGSYMRHCLARLIRSLIFASIRPHYRLCPDGQTLGFRRFGARRLRHKILFVHTKRGDATLLPEQDPDLISGAVTMDDATFTTFLSLVRGTSVMYRFNCGVVLDRRSSQSVFRYGCTPSSIRQ